MPQYQAIGPGPISLLDSHQSQLELPLSLIYFDSGLAKVSSAWTPYAANQSVVDALLKQLVSEGVLFAGTTVISAPAPALTVTALQTGTGGNFLSVQFANPNTTVTPNTIDVTVTAAETFPGLTVDTVAASLGTSDATANGLVFVVLPVGTTPAGVSNVTSTSGAAPFQIAIPEAANAANTSLDLQVIAAADSIATQIKVTVTPDPLPATTFTLAVNWTQTAAAQTLATLEGGGNPFASLVTFTAAPSGTLPAAGTVVLQGGGPPAIATTATATALSA